MGAFQKGVNTELYSGRVHNSLLLTLPLAASLRHLAATHREVTAGSNSCCRIMASRRSRKLMEEKREGWIDGWMERGVNDDGDKKALMINHQFKTSPTQINRKRSRRGMREVLGIFSVILSDLDLRTYLGTSTSSSMKRSGSPSQLRSPPNLLRRDSWERTDAEWNLGGSFDWKEKNK